MTKTSLLKELKKHDSNLKFSKLPKELQEETELFIKRKFDVFLKKYPFIGGLFGGGLGVLLAGFGGAGIAAMGGAFPIPFFFMLTAAGGVCLGWIIAIFRVYVKTGKINIKNKTTKEVIIIINNF